MPSLEGLALAGQVNNQSADQINDASNQFKLQAVASQASDLAKQGDFQGAYSLLFKARPDLAEKILPQMAQTSPQLAQSLAQSKENGSLQSQGALGSGSIPVQVAKINAQAKLAAEKNKSSDTVVRNDINSPTGQSITNKKTGVKQYATMSGLPNKPDETPQLRPNEDINSEGKKIMLSPEQQKVIKESRKTFDSETKDIVKGLDAAHQGSTMVNNPDLKGVEALERLRVLRSVVQNRISQQEFQAFGGDMGLVTNLENKLQKLKDGKLTPEMRQIYTNILDVTQKALSSQYDQHLKNAVERNPEVDPLILKKRLVGSSGPSVYQAVTKKVGQLPPDAQALFNWAHDNPGPKADSYLKQLNQKYNLGQ